MSRQKEENGRFTDENWPGAGLGRTYDLRRDNVGRKIAIKLERVKERSLPLIHITEDSGSCGLLLAASMNDEQFANIRELRQGLVNTDLESGLVQLSLEQRGQRQRQDAIEGVDTDFLVGPMEHRLPGDEMRVLHGPEGVLNFVLAAISQHNILIGPIVAVGEEQCLAEKSVAKGVYSGGIDTVTQAGYLALAMWLQREGEDFFHVASGEYFIDILLGPAHGGRLAGPYLSPDPAVEAQLQFMELPSALLDLLRKGYKLLRVEVVVEGHQNRALDTENLFLGPVRANRYQAFPLERFELLAVKCQKFRVLGGHQRADKSIEDILEQLHPFLGVIALVEDKCDLGASFGERGIALHQLVDDAAELDRIGDVPIVGLMEQGDMEVRGNQKGQADLAKVVAPVFVMPALRQFPRGACADKGKEVGGIKSEAAQVEMVGGDEAAVQSEFDGANLRFAQVAHMIPKSLAGQLARLGRAEPAQDGFSVPCRQRALALWTYGAVDGGQREVLAYRKSLIPFRDVGIDNLKEMNLFDDAPDRRNRAKIGDGDPPYGGRTPELFDGGHNVLVSAEVDGARDLGPAVDPAAFTSVVVRMPADNLFGETCHVEPFQC